MSDYDDDDMPRPPRRSEPRRPSPLYKANNEGGYGNPPISQQFQPGNQGGPGRTKGVTSLESALRTMFASKVRVTKDGKTVEMDMTDAMVERLRQLMLSKDLKAFKFGLELMQKYGPRNEQPEVILGFDWGGMSFVQKRALYNLLRSLTPYDRRELMTSIRELQRNLGRDPKKKKDE